MSVQNIMEDKLNQSFTPAYLNLVNKDEFNYALAGQERFFQLTLVCQAFDGMSILERHCLVKQVLKAELDSNIDSLLLHTYTPSEWFHLFSSYGNAYTSHNPHYIHVA